MIAQKNWYSVKGVGLLTAVFLAHFASSAAELPIAPGPFSSSAESLTNYSCPEWFRDAKFGIWAHWGPQAVPRAGDWYARNMYLQGSPQYESHLKNYGHPSTNGYKDIIPLWKAEKWDPNALMALYVKAGAKYFVSMGVHHDNFDLWNSKFHSWNAVKMGPHRDIVGDWKKAAQKYAMRFGVSEHLGPSFGWYAPSHGYDQFGEPGAKLGVPYDGADPKFQELYHPANDEPFRWGTSWYATNSAWHQEWFNRIKDLLDQSQPDLLYTDGGIPFGEVGRSLLAHFYNANAAAHGGKLEAVYNFKNLGTGEFIREAGVEDVERGVMPGINPLPWQTCTSMGDWFYSDGFKYKTTAEVVHMLADIVSKNGNLLLNVVLYADGSLPPESRQFLDEMAAWMSVNGEAIYGTRPWKIFGEGPTVAASGFFKEDTAYTPQDIRFTTKAGALYAISLGWPADGKVLITSLAKTNDASVNRIERIELLGGQGELKFTQTAAGLTVELPAQKISDIACTLKITGTNLQPVKVPAPAAEILTPPAPDAPRINGPNIYGVRPGAPFLYTIPATGIRPMTFSADHLPTGLKLDFTTGRITGALENAGEYKLTLRANNSLGVAEKNIRIVGGDDIALTPAMGWNSWNCWAGAVDQEKVLRSARAMAASGLAQHGWTYINIDDTWQGKRGGNFNAIQPNEKFPDMKVLCDEIHALGLKAGIYSTPWVNSYGGHIGGSAENPAGDWTNAPTKAPRNKKVLPYAVGQYSFATNDAEQFAAWGFDYLKYDWNPIERSQVLEMADALRATKRDIILSLSNNSRDRLLDRIADIAPLAQSWRTTGDINDSWGSLRNIGFNQNEWTQFSKPGHWNDPDMLIIGWVGWGPKLHPTKFTPDEQYTHISLWCLLSAPLLIGCDLEKLDAFTLGLLSNDEVLAVDQDSLGKQAVCVATNGDLRVYAKDLEDGSKAVGLFNLGESQATVTAQWADLKVSGKQTARDLWRQKNIGNFSNEFTATVSSHGVVLIRLIPEK